MKRVTLKNLADCSEMEVFEYVRNHLLSQREKSLMSPQKQLCAYKSTEGLKCAIGCLMTSREYKKSFEGLPWEDLVAAELVPIAHNRLLCDLQKCHDDESVKDWESALDNIKNKIESGIYSKMPF